MHTIDHFQTLLVVFSLAGAAASILVILGSRNRITWTILGIGSLAGLFYWGSSDFPNAFSVVAYGGYGFWVVCVYFGLFRKRRLFS